MSACGGDSDTKKAEPETGGLCGNGTVDPGELCDTAIASGAGACPSQCSAPQCKTATLAGRNCTAQCVVEDVGCISGDGCCTPGCDRTTDDDCDNLCGDDVVEGSEICDGNCPTECPSGTACQAVALTGDAQTCNVACETETISTCIDGDGCCAPGCNANNDDDCGLDCGNGVVEPGELCDGNCPVCDDGDACTRNVQVGSAETCNVVCEFNPIGACQDGDGCCPDGCSNANDNDCSTTCGDNVVDPGETCDGNCPNSCDDGDVCTSDRRSGSDQTCNVTCSNTSITACIDNDGCCPDPCEFATDNDCSCVPTTCAAENVECGQISDGCNGVLECGDCANGTCVAGQCESSESGLLGDPCSSASDCDATAPICRTDLPGGYCTSECTLMCENGGVCVGDDIFLGECRTLCVDDSECRAGYECIAAGVFGFSACLPI